VAHARFPQLNDRDDLWRLLVLITARKAIDQPNHERRKSNPELRSVAVWKMEGHSNEEIVAKQGCMVRSVERKLRLIRDRWAREIRL
jgi:hypothetical protein